MNELQSFFLDERTLPSSFLLQNYSIVEIKGEDASDFLSNQLTSEVKNLENYTFQESSIVDIKGRVVCSFFLGKKEDAEYFAVFDRRFKDELLDRLNLYLISEDVSFNYTDKSPQFILNYKGEYNGKCFGLNCSINFSANKEINPLSETKLKYLRFCSGMPMMGTHVNPGELITNSFLAETSINFNKGCYPGQETISKIHNNKGASFFPVVLKGESEILVGDIRIDGKKIGVCLESIEMNNTYYHYVNINRENRVESKVLNVDDKKYLVLSFPLLDNSSESLSQSLFDKAVEFFHNDDNEQAKELLNRAIQINPQFSDAYESLGVILGREKRFEDAIEVMKKLSEVNPRSVMAYTNMSMYYMQLGDKETAEEHKATATIKQFEMFGHEADAKRKQEEAEENKRLEKEQRLGMFLQVLEIDPEDALANLGLGELELEKENYSKAIDHLEQAIKSNERYSVAYLALGKAYIGNRKEVQAKETLTKGIEVASKNGDLMPANEMQSLLSNLG